jgi:hypothetical protein
MRKVVVGIAVLGAVLVVSVYAFAAHIAPLADTPEPVFTVEHDIEIPASAQEIWSVLTDFEAYPEWNPYVVFIEGGDEDGVKIGDVITLTIVEGNFPDSLTLSPTITRLKDRRTFGWHGTLAVAGLHETDHYFEIEPLPGGRTRFHHAEEFRGWLPALMNSEEQLAPTREAFRLMNEALAKRVIDLR